MEQTTQGKKKKEQKHEIVKLNYLLTNMTKKH